MNKSVPQPLPSQLLGEKWRFASFLASQMLNFLQDQPIPLLYAPPELLPLQLGIASDIAIPGVVIDGGKKSMQLAKWIEQSQPRHLQYITTEQDIAGGLILTTKQQSRWIIATLHDPEVARAGQKYEQRKKQSAGLHFLLIEPDDTGITYTGFWLLKT